jgi:hypothetical protein
MKARSQRWTWPTFPEGWIDAAVRGEAALSASTLDIGTTGFMPLVVGFALPDVVTSVSDEGEAKTRYLHRSSPSGDSCAAITYEEGQPTVTYTYGPEDLAGEFVAAVSWFRDHGQPEPEGFGLTVGPEGQHVWFGSSRGPTSPPYPRGGVTTWRNAQERPRQPL